MMVLNNPTRLEQEDIREGVDVDATPTMKTPMKPKSSNMVTQSKVRYWRELLGMVVIDTLCETVR